MELAALPAKRGLRGTPTGNFDPRFGMNKQPQGPVDSFFGLDTNRMFGFKNQGPAEMDLAAPPSALMARAGIKTGPSHALPAEMLTNSETRGRNFGGGVTPGEVPPMNAVERARMGLGGTPYGGRDPNDPRNAAIAAYR